jgi:hypothetical protein
VARIWQYSIASDTLTEVAHQICSIRRVRRTSHGGRAVRCRRCLSDPRPGTCSMSRRTTPTAPSWSRAVSYWPCTSHPQVRATNSCRSPCAEGRWAMRLGRRPSCALAANVALTLQGLASCSLRHWRKTGWNTPGTSAPCQDDAPGGDDRDPARLMSSRPSVVTLSRTAKVAETA